MLSIRTRITVIIITAVSAAIAASLVTGLYLNRNYNIQFFKDALFSIEEISSKLISGELNRLRDETMSIAELSGRSRDIQGTLEQQLNRNSSFLNLAVLSRDGTLLFAGNSETRPPIRSIDSEYGKRALAGETIITSIFYTPDGNLVMRIWCPVDENRVLIAGISGLYLSMFLGPCSVFESGEILIIDSEGFIIAENARGSYVQERRNYIELGNRYPEYRETGRIFKSIVENDSGTELYNLSGEKRICAYRTIDGTDNWSLAVSASMNESPINKINNTLISCAVILFVLAIIAALIISKVIVDSFEKTMAAQAKTAPAAGREIIHPIDAVPPVSQQQKINTGGIFQDVSVSGLNIKEALESLANDEETYMLVLRSYITYTPAFLDTIQLQDLESIDRYRIAVHGLKGSSRSIGAFILGDEAEKLEHAAVEKDMDYIETNTDPFITAVEEMMNNISALISDLDAKSGKSKPEMEKPDPELINAVLNACKVYDIEALKKAIDSLDCYTYNSWPDLTEWLNEQADISNFDEIQRRLE